MSMILYGGAWNQRPSSRIAGARFLGTLRPQDCRDWASTQCQSTSNGWNAPSCRRLPALRSLRHRLEPKIYRTLQQPGVLPLATVEPPAQHLAVTLPLHKMPDSDPKQRDPSSARKG